MASIKVDEFEVLTGLYYSKEHEWVKIENGTGRVGITDYAQKSLHEVVYVDLPEVGASVAQMKSMGTVESVKAVSDIYSPLSGKIIEVNEKLTDSPELVNKSPYEAGWIARIEPKALNEELKNLMTAEQYAKYIEELLEKE